MGLNIKDNVWQCNYCGESGGMLALYAKVYGISNPDAYRSICDALQTGRSAPEYEPQRRERLPKEVPQSEQADAQAVHHTMSALLAALLLTPGHREHLRAKRGLTDAQIEQFGFKSTPPPHLCRSLTSKLIQKGYTVQGIPGFYMNDPPEKAETKYLPMTSAGKKPGVTSGSPIHFVGDPCSRVVYVTEGALKADIAHALTGRTFAATAGANNTSGLDGLFAFLHAEIPGLSAGPGGHEDLSLCVQRDRGIAQGRISAAAGRALPAGV